MASTTSAAVGPTDPRPLESLPSSEEDLTTHARDSFDDGVLDKGKRKATATPSESDESSDTETEEAPHSAGVYPPTNDDEAETKRIEENLRRWEVNERQRRKTARESLTIDQGTPSLLRGASLLWSGGGHKRPSQAAKHGIFSSQGHTVLSSRESLDVMPLSDIPDSASPMTPTMPSPSTSQPTNPFSDPPGASTSALVSSVDGVQQTEAVMSPTTDPVETPRAEKKLSEAELNGRPVLMASSSSFTKPPPPAPLGLPPPRTPPPRIPSPSSPLDPVNSRQQDGEEPPVRWWHEWLCGCSEGPDRGGDNQAGRTNPFE